MKQFNATLMLTMLMSLAAVEALAYDIEVENEDGMTLYYNYIADGKELEVTYRYTGCYQKEIAVRIPESVTFMNKTRKVTAIGKNAFRDCKITSIEIPNSVTTIESYAFCNCLNLTSVKMGSGLTTIRNDAFSSCPNLVTADIPEGVTTIEESAFGGCSSLIAVRIPDGGVEIGSHAFGECSSLTSVHIGSYLKAISYEAFENCTALHSITIPGNVETIEVAAFRRCKNLGTVILENGIKTIESSAFYWCSSLSSVVIPNSVETIGSSAFEHCESLVSVTIGDNVTTIDGSAFEYCLSLKKVIVHDLSNWCRIKFSRAYANPLWYANHLYSDEDTEITKLIIPGDVTSVEDYAFQFCNGLVSVTIPSNVETIGTYAFGNCEGLTSLTIGSGVRTISQRACNSPNLATVVSFAEEPPTIYNNTLSDNTFKNATLKVPQGSIDKYESTDGWKEFVWPEGFDPTGVRATGCDGSPAEVSRFTLNGRKATTPSKGINIVKTSSGATKKVVVK